jgi:hypothetical protein
MFAIDAANKIIEYTIPAPEAFEPPLSPCKDWTKKSWYTQTEADDFYARPFHVGRPLPRPKAKKAFVSWSPDKTPASFTTTQQASQELPALSALASLAANAPAATTNDGR